MDIHKSRKVAFDCIKLLFSGSTFDCVEIYQFHNNHNVKKTIQQESAPRNTDGERDYCPKRIVGVEFDDIASCKKKLFELLREIPLASVTAFYFVVEKRQQLPLMMKVIKEHSLGEPKVYGIDDDYFLSLVLLTGTGHKNIENYILGLKVTYSIINEVKLMIKKLLVYLQWSHRLYQAFVVVVQPPSMSGTQSP